MKRKRIGPKIKQLRKSKSLTQKQLADALGYSDKSMITHIEKGDSDMTYEKILLLLRTYALDANELFDVDDIDKQLLQCKAEKQNINSYNLYAYIEPEIKEQTEKILASLGISPSEAINMFYKQIILHNGLPFSLGLPSKPKK